MSILSTKFETLPLLSVYWSYQLVVKNTTNNTGYQNREFKPEYGPLQDSLSSDVLPKGFKAKCGAALPLGGAHAINPTETSARPGASPGVPAIYTRNHLFGPGSESAAPTVTCLKAVGAQRLWCGAPGTWPSPSLFTTRGRTG